MTRLSTRVGLFMVFTICLGCVRVSSAAPAQSEDEPDTSLDQDSLQEDHVGNSLGGGPVRSSLDGEDSDGDKLSNKLLTQEDDDPEVIEEHELEHGVEHTDDDSDNADDKHVVKHEDTHEDKHEKHHHWSYLGPYGPSNWSALVPLCNSSNWRQSPIDIITDKTHLDDTLDEISLTKVAPADIEDVVITNNGHTVNLKFNSGIRVLGGALEDNYRVGGVHFHWGNSDAVGSEHKVDGHPFPLEMHIVTYDESRFDSLDARAVFGDNSLAVLGVLFEISAEDNAALDPITLQLHTVQQKGISTNMTHFDLSELLPTSTDQYYRYHGSLTTPPCAESVIWTVFEHKQTISSKQLAAFRQLQEGFHDNGDMDYLDHNYRPVQPLHHRKVQRSFQLEKSKSAEVRAKDAETGHGAAKKNQGAAKKEGAQKMENKTNSVSRVAFASTANVFNAGFFAFISFIAAHESMRRS